MRASTCRLLGDERDVQQRFRIAALKSGLGIGARGILCEGNRVAEMYRPIRERYLTLARAIGFDTDDVGKWAKKSESLSALLNAIENDDVLDHMYPDEETENFAEQYVLGFRYIVENSTDDQKGDDGEFFVVAAAKRLKDQLEQRGYLDQHDARSIVLDEFGPAYTYTNVAGGRGINKIILEHFRTICPNCRWDKSTLTWHLE